MQRTEGVRRWRLLLYRLGASPIAGAAGPAVWVAVVVLLGVGAATLARLDGIDGHHPGDRVAAGARPARSNACRRPAVANASARIVFTAEGRGTLIESAKAAAIKQALKKVGGPAARGGRRRSVRGQGDRPRRADGDRASPLRHPAGRDDRRAAAGPADGRTQRPVGRRQVEFGGSAISDWTLSQIPEIVAVGIAAVVLLITFGSLVAAGLPLLTAVVGVGVGLLGHRDRHPLLRPAVGRRSCSRSCSASRSASTTRCSSSRATGTSSRRALGRGGRRARRRRPPVRRCVFAGLTVIIALAALAVVGIPFLTAMGLAAAGTVLVAVLVALTLLPALLGFAGERVLGRRGRAARDTEGDAGKAPWAPAGRASSSASASRSSSRSCWRCWRCALPARDLRLGLPDDGSAPSGTTQRAPTTRSPRAFGAGLQRAAGRGRRPAGVDDAEAAAAAIRRTSAPCRASSSSRRPRSNEAGDTAILTVIPTSGPSDQATTDLVKAIREHAARLGAARPAPTALVTGETAMAIDISQKLQARAPPVPGGRRRARVRPAHAWCSARSSCRSRRRSASC